MTALQVEDSVTMTQLILNHLPSAVIQSLHCRTPALRAHPPALEQYHRDAGTNFVSIRLLVRIFLRRPNVPDQHYAGQSAGGTEIGTLLLLTVLSGRDFSRAVERRRALASTRDPNRMAFSHLVNCAKDVASRIAPLAGGRIENLFFEFAMIFFRDRAPLVLR